MTIMPAETTCQMLLSRPPHPSKGAALELRVRLRRQGALPAPVLSCQAGHPEELETASQHWIGSWLPRRRPVSISSRGKIGGRRRNI
ncbi:unnamed protein product [Ixodes pacificus]